MKAGGSRSGVRDPTQALPSSAAAVGSTGVLLTFCSPAPSHKQKRGDKIVDVTKAGGAGSATGSESE